MTSAGSTSRYATFMRKYTDDTMPSPVPKASHAVLRLTQSLKWTGLPVHTRRILHPGLATRSLLRLRYTMSML